MMHYFRGVTATLTAIFLIAPSNAWADDSSSAALVRITTKSGKSYLGEMMKENATTIAIRDLDSGRASEYERTTLTKVESPLNESEAARYLGLPKLIAWKIGHLPDKGPVVGKIAKITPTVVYLNLGEASGIVPEQQLTVYRNAEEVIDPDTKKVLTHERQKLAKLQVVEVAKAYSKAKMLGELETPLAVGDEVESVGEKLLIAVLPIRGGDENDAGNILTEQFTTTLANKRIPLVERALLDKVLVEQILQNTVLFDEKTAQQIGRQLGATAVLTGKIVGRNEAHVRLIQVSSGRILLAAYQQLSTVRSATSRSTPKDSDAPDKSSRSEFKPLSSNALPGFAAMRNEAAMTKDGLVIKPGTVLRTKTGDYLKRDFLFEIVYTFPKSSSLDINDQIVHIGIGDDSLKNGSPGICVGLAIRPGSVNDGRLTLLKEDGGRGAGREELVGLLRKPGPHRIRIEKSGSTVSFHIDVDNDGASVDDLEMTIPDIAEFAPSLNEKNSYLYLGGGAVFSNSRLNPGSLSAPASILIAPLAKDSAMMPLSRGKPWPSFLRSGDNAVIVKDGLEVQAQKFVVSKRADFVEKDFIFEAELVFPAWTERSPLDQIVHIGIGEPNQGQSPETCIYTSIRPPDVNDGYTDVGTNNGGRNRGGSSKRLTNLRSRGPHLFRIEKKGTAVTFSVDIDADGKGEDDVEVTIPDIAEYTPFLHAKNSHLFFGGGARFTKVRLAVE